jgi:hypothetical protein
MKIFGKISVLLSALCLVGGCKMNDAIEAQGEKKSLKILMIGNSFSICNTKNMPQICQSMGLDLELGSLYIGGCSLELHWKNVQNAKDGFAPYGYRFFKDGKRDVGSPAKWNIPEALKSKKWDVVTIQQASHFSIDRATFSPYGEDLIKTIKELCPTAEVVIQETWSYTPYDNRLVKWGINQDEMYERLHKAYYQFAKDNSIRVIPTGEAVQMWRKKLPVKYTANSFGGDVAGSMTFAKQDDGMYKVYVDRFHFNAKGEYLQSLVWTAKLFGVDVTKCNFIRDKTIGTENCRLMQKIANEVCK